MAQANGLGTDWEGHNVAAAHNRALSAAHGDAALRFCDAYANASHEAGHGGNPNSWTDNGYSSLATVGPKTGMTCYIREEIQGLPLFLQPPKACVGQGPMFCMRFHVG